MSDPLGASQSPPSWPEQLCAHMQALGIVEDVPWHQLPPYIRDSIGRLWDRLRHVLHAEDLREEREENASFRWQYEHGVSHGFDAAMKADDGLLRAWQLVHEMALQGWSLSLASEGAGDRLWTARFTAWGQTQAALSGAPPVKQASGPTAAEAIRCAVSVPEYERLRLHHE